MWLCTLFQEPVPLKLKQVQSVDGLTGFRRAGDSRVVRVRRRTSPGGSVRVRLLVLSHHELYDGTVRVLFDFYRTFLRRCPSSIFSVFSREAEHALAAALGAAGPIALGPRVLQLPLLGETTEKAAHWRPGGRFNRTTQITWYQERSEGSQISHRPFISESCRVESVMDMLPSTKMDSQAWWRYEDRQSIQYHDVHVCIISPLWSCVNEEDSLAAQRVLGTQFSPDCDVLLLLPPGHSSGPWCRRGGTHRNFLYPWPAPSSPTTHNLYETYRSTYQTQMYKHGQHWQLDCNNDD